ncbi:MAG: FeoB small GTPase domain-containing protein, partial [Nitrospirota bacterium]
MTTDELEKLLVEQPVDRLHRLARGRIHRHFRLGKRRLVDALLRQASVNRAGLESDLQALMQEGTRSATPAGPRHRSVPPVRHAGRSGQAESAEPAEPAADLSAFLDGIGVPPPRPFIPDPWQEEALSHLATTDVIVSVVDATNLNRHLFLATQLLELGKPMVIALNMIDLAESAGLRILPDLLAKELGVPVVPVVATTGRGIHQLSRAIVDALNKPPAPFAACFPP